MKRLVDHINSLKESYIDQTWSPRLASQDIAFDQPDRIGFLKSWNDYGSSEKLEVVSGSGFEVGGLGTVTRSKTIPYGERIQPHPLADGDIEKAQT